MGRITQAQVQERFTRLYVEEYSDGSFHYAVLREDGEPRACVMDCPIAASFAVVDVEDENSGGVPLCTHHKEKYFQEQLEDFSYTLVPVTTAQAWHGTDSQGRWIAEGSGWANCWPLFAAPGTFGKNSDWPEFG